MEYTRITKRRFRFIWLVLILIPVCVVWGILAEPGLWDFDRPVSDQEKAMRLEVVETAAGWLGCKESDGSHKPIIDVYNSHLPLARGYAVQYDDEWCATFVSAVAVQTDKTDIIPTECGCERQIELFQAIGAWVEDDGYTPLPGDVIYYHWNCMTPGDCADWSDHVGIVVGTWNGWIKVIEGNRHEDVSYRCIRVNDRQIRGYGTPDYT